MILSKYIYSYNRLFYLCVLLLIPFFIHANVSVLTTSGLSNAIKSDGVYVWKNIPYAKPPIGDLRWKAPQEIPSTNKVVSGKGSGCIQEPSRYAGLEGEGVVGSEDCLYLDIYQPISQKKIVTISYLLCFGSTEVAIQLEQKIIIIFQSYLPRRNCCCSNKLQTWSSGMVSSSSNSISSRRH